MGDTVSQPANLFATAFQFLPSYLCREVREMRRNGGPQGDLVFRQQHVTPKPKAQFSGHASRSDGPAATSKTPNCLAKYLGALRPQKRRELAAFPPTRAESTCKTCFDLIAKANLHPSKQRIERSCDFKIPIVQFKGPVRVMPGGSQIRFKPIMGKGGDNFLGQYLGARRESHTK